MTKPEVYTEITKRFYKDLQKAMRAEGYKYKRWVHSALEELEWTKGDRVVTVSGWHGTAFWSQGKVAFSLFVDGKEEIELINVLVDIDDECMLPGVLERYESALKEVKKIALNG